MPKILKALTEKQVRSLTKTTHLGGVPGFLLTVTKRSDGSLSKRYTLRIKLTNGKLTDRSIGNFENLSYKQAKQRALTLRQELLDGIDYSLENRRQHIDKTIPSLEENFLRWLDSKCENNHWSDCTKTRKDNLARLYKYFPNEILSMPVTSISPEVLAKHLTPHWKETHESCRRFCKYLEQSFDWGMRQKYFSPIINPAVINNGALGDLLCRMKGYRGHYGALSCEQIPQFFFDLLNGDRLFSTSALFIAFDILTAARSGSIICSTWNEINVQTRTHTIPRQRMKFEEIFFDRRTPLSEEALFVLKQLPRFEQSEYVFVNHLNPLRGHITQTAYTNLIKRMCQKGYAWHDLNLTTKDGKPRRITVHGTARATFKSWAKDAKTFGHSQFEEDLIERCLDHAGGYADPYIREQPIGEMRNVFDEWGKFCFSRLKP